MFNYQGKKILKFDKQDIPGSYLSSVDSSTWLM